MTTPSAASGTINGASYQAALSHVAIADQSTRGCLRLTERDRADLIHRLSTNDVRALLPGQGTRTVLLNHNARIIDLLTVYALPEHVLLTTSPGQGAAITHLLQKNIFFNDQVKLEDLSGETVQQHVYGPKAAALLRDLTSVDPGDWPLHHVQAVEIKGEGAWLARTLPIGGDGFVLLSTRAAWEQFAAAFKAVPQLDQATYEVLRIEAGYPGWAHELTLDYIPLETGLNDAISFSKGCYVGQEIIARMDSRQRLAKQLMALRLSAPLVIGSKLLLDGKEQGTITSVADSPRLGLIALAYIRTEHAQPGTQLQTSEGIAVEVVALP